MIATGTLEDGTFTASEVLARHDESYMPKEVADALKEQGAVPLRRRRRRQARRADGRRAVGAATVRRLVAAQFPVWADLPLRPVPSPGWDNVTFRLGDALKVRLPSAARYAPQVAREAGWLRRLAPLLPLPIPVPLAVGVPGEGFAFPWTVAPWLAGEPLSRAALPGDPAEAESALATDLAAFLRALRAARADGPSPGADNFHRGGDLAVYDAETRAALAALGPVVDARRAGAVWEAALASRRPGPPVPVHGDVAPGNLLVRDGRLAAVIDWGSAAVGDPACDLVIAWTFLSPMGRAAFRAELPGDGATWARARGWAL